MGTSVYKIPGDTERYVVWSSVTESPYIWGSYEVVRDYLVDTDHLKPEYARPEVDARMQRAKEFGTSSLTRRTPEFEVFEQKGLLSFGDLGRFLDSYNDLEDRFDETLLTPWEDDDDEDD